MKLKKQNKWRFLFILITIVAIGWACDDDVQERKYTFRGDHIYYPECGQLVMKLNKGDHRFENLKTIGRLDNVYKSGVSDSPQELFFRNDSIFLLYNDTLFYPTRLPNDFLQHLRSSSGYDISGIIKKKPVEGVDYYPLILEKLVLHYLMKFDK